MNNHQDSRHSWFLVGVLDDAGHKMLEKQRFDVKNRHTLCVATCDSRIKICSRSFFHQPEIKNETKNRKNGQHDIRTLYTYDTRYVWTLGLGFSWILYTYTAVVFKDAGVQREAISHGL